MPVYEYAPLDRECLMCPGSVSVIQDIGDGPLLYCPYCGLDVKRVVSQVSFKVGSGNGPDAAAKAGFTTWRRSGLDTWERVAGEGATTIQREPEAKVSKAPSPKVLDLDEG